MKGVGKDATELFKTLGQSLMLKKMGLEIKKQRFPFENWYVYIIFMMPKMVILN